MTQVMQEVLDLLDLEVIEANLFRGSSLNIVGKNVFGGQVLAQALMAAGRTTDGRLANSMHGYFLRAGDTTALLCTKLTGFEMAKVFPHVW